MHFVPFRLKQSIQMKCLVFFCSNRLFEWVFLECVGWSVECVIDTECVKYDKTIIL